VEQDLAHALASNCRMPALQGYDGSQPCSSLQLVAGMSLDHPGPASTCEGQVTEHTAFVQLINLFSDRKLAFESPRLIRPKSQPACKKFIR
jgi:hypothetical protein